MNNKTYLAWLFNSNSLNGTLATHSFLIEKLCENFEKLYFINLMNLKFSSKNKINMEEFNYQIDPKFKIPKNIEIFNFKTEKELKHFVLDKKLIAITINNFGTNLPNLKNLLLFKKTNIK